MRIATTLVAVLLLISFSRAAETAPSTQPQSFTGTLRHLNDAGGAHWTLVGEGASGGMDVDISNVEDDAKELEGKRVTLEGRMAPATQEGDARPPRVKAEKISPAPEKKPSE